MSTRIFELAKLQVKHYRLDLATKDEYKWPHDECSLDQRKGWQHNLSKEGNLESVLFFLGVGYSPLKSIQVIVMKSIRNLSCPRLTCTTTHQGLLFLQIGVYCRELHSNNYIFPSISGNGSSHPDVPISHDTIQKWLDEFVREAGIRTGSTRLTTHCFRRGGAQYRFMYAPVGKRWSLATIRWWGGWAEGEHVCTYWCQ
jgi:hypothetical protein